MIHELKTWPDPFAAILDGRKAFEVRKADRPFMVGDTLHLREWNPNGSGYTGRETAVVVTYLVSPGAWGLPPDLCVMGFGSPPSPPETPRPTTPAQSSAHPAARAGFAGAGAEAPAEREAPASPSSQPLSAAPETPAREGADEDAINEIERLVLAYGRDRLEAREAGYLPGKAWDAKCRERDASLRRVMDAVRKLARPASPASAPSRGSAIPEPVRIALMLGDVPAVMGESLAVLETLPYADVQARRLATARDTLSMALVSLRATKEQS